jgi:predicted ATPase
MRLTILATSREALGMAGEQPWWVPSLGLPDPRARLTLEQGDHGLAGTRFAESLAAARDTGELGQIAETLEAQVNLAAAQDQPGRVLRLAGAAARRRDEAGQPLSAAEHSALAQRLARARQALSAEETAAAWAEGQSMTLEQAIAYALEEPTHG